MRRLRHGLAFVVLAVLAVGAALALRHAPTPAPVSSAWAVRSPAQRTLVLAAGAGFTVDEYATDTTRQQLSVRNEQGAAQVWAYDPGMFDPESLVRGQPVRFGGHEAWYAREPVPTLFWRGAHGSWLAVGGSVPEGALFQLARSVRLSPPAPVVGPVGLTWLPPGLSLTYARIGTGTSSEILTARGRGSYDVRISSYAVASNDWTNGTVGLGAPSMMVAGHLAWYSMDAGDHSQVLLEAGSCGVRVQVSDRGRVPLAVIEQLLTRADLGPCDDVDGWPPILS